MLFKVFSRHQAESSKAMTPELGDLKYIWISIYTPGCDPAKVHQHPENCKGVLHVEFYDLSKDDKLTGCKAMCLEDAKNIVDFVQEVKDKIDCICLHCDAGVSRSPGCAAALSLWLNGHDRDIQGMTRVPNITCKATILRYLRESNLI